LTSLATLGILNDRPATAWSRAPARAHRKRRTSTATRTTTKAPENLLDAVHSSQETALELAQKWTNSIGEIVPGIWNESIREGIPAAREFSDATFGFAHEVLDAQHAFAKRIVDGLRGELEKLS
jgi:hypothetical protein